MASRNRRYGKSISARMTYEMETWLKAKAKARDESVGEMIRRAVAKDMKEDLRDAREA